MHDPRKRRRQSYRLKGWDYSRSGAYFITVCSHGRRCIFGDVLAGRMFLNSRGMIVREEWARSEGIRREFELDVFVVMPNHLHGIVFLSWPGDEFDAHRPESWKEWRRKFYSASRSRPLPLPEAPYFRREAQSISSFMAGFKSTVTRRIRRELECKHEEVWQRNFWDRILRSRREWLAARRYILENPRRWYRDRNHPNNWQDPQDPTL